MGDQPPTAGTTTTPPQDLSVVELLLSLKDDKQRQALERYLTSQLVEQPRAAVQRAETAIVDAAESVPYFGPRLKQAALKQSVEKIAQDLVAPVERAMAIQNAPVEGLDPAAGADPIELATGQLAYTHTDLSLDGAGICFEFIRTYRSHARYPNGPLGSCWDHNYNLWLREVDANTIAVGTGRLREDRYRRVSPGGPDPDYFATDAGNDNILVQNAKTQKYELHEPAGITHQFAPLGAFHAEDAGLHRLERTFDRFQRRNAITGEPEPPGNYLHFTYDTNDTHLLRAIAVNHPTRKVLLDYDDLGRLISLTDYAGRRVLYTYDDYDDLVAITLPPTQDRHYGRSTFYEYTSEVGPIAHLLTSVIDADGRRYLEVEYGMEDGFVDRQRVIRQRDNEGEWLLQYADLDVTRDPNNPPDPDLPVRYTCVIQPNGHQVEYWFNDLGNALFKADRYLDGEGVPHNALWRFQYNPDGKLIASLSPEGIFVQHYYARDEYTLGNGLHVADPLSALPPPTAAQRMAFGTLRATVRRAKAPLPLLTWPDPAIAKSILNTTANDIVQIFEFEPDAQLPLRVSDPRATADLVTPPTRWLVEYAYSPDAYKFPVSISYPATQRPDGSLGPAAKELFKCDLNGRVTDHTDAEGHTTHNEYYKDTDPPAGSDTHFGVELIPQPNPLRLTGYLKSTTVGWGEPNAAMRSFQVNRRGLPVITTDARGAVTTQVLDTTDQPIEVTRSLKPGVDYTTKYRYTGQAKIFRTESEIADDTGAPVLVDGTPLGSAVRQYRYTDIEQIRRDSVGGLDTRTFLTTRHLYNGSGLPARHFSPGNSVTRVGYDSRRLPTRSAQGYGTDEVIETKTFYDRDGRTIATMDGRGCVTRTEYDALGRKAREIQVVDRPVGAPDARPIAQRLGHTKVFTYDKLDNVIQERFFQWLPGDNYELLSRTQFEFDERGRKLKEIRDVFAGPVNAGVASLDAFASAAPPGAEQIETWLFLDRNGRVIERREGVVTAGPNVSQGSCIKTDYDHSGRTLVSRVLLLDRGNAEVTRTQSTYDLNGNLLRTDRFDREYDNTGALVRTEVISRAYEYDSLNRRVAEIDGLGNRISHRYDSRDLLVETTDALGYKTRFDYDLYGRKQRVTQSPAPTLEILSSFEFDADGQVIAVIRGDENNPALATTRYEFNAVHRKTKATAEPGTPLERITSWQYDAAGNVVGQVQPSGLEIRMTYGYTNRLERVEFDDGFLKPFNPPSGGATEERFEHDGLGRVVLAETDAGLTSIASEYDSLGRLHTDTQSLQGEPSVTIRRTFTALGQRRDLTYPSNHTLRFQTDLAGRLERVVDRARGAPNVGLPGAGARDVLVNAHIGRRPRSTEFASGVQTVRAYDGAGRLIGIDHRDATGMSFLNLIAFYDATYNVRAEWQTGSQSLTAARSYEYDDLSRLLEAGTTAAAAPNVSNFAPGSVPTAALTGQAAVDAAIVQPAAIEQSYQYDAGSNRIAETIGGTLTPVDALDRLIGPTYDDTGNPVARNGATLQFDARNRLVRWDDATSTFEAVYDALGRRVLVEQGAISRRFVYDDASEIAEYRNGVLFAESLVSAPPDGRSIFFNGGEEFALHSDRLSSVRAVTDSTGAVVGRYDFDPYGQLEAGVIDLPVLSHRFMEREWDGTLGLYHFRSRHYDPTTGAFLQRDPIETLTGESVYRAFASNPLIYVDPMGTSGNHVGHEASVLASAPSAARSMFASLYRNVGFRSGKLLDGPLNLYSGFGRKAAERAAGYMFQDTTLYMTTAARGAAADWVAASSELAIGEGLNMGAIRSFGLTAQHYTKTIQWNTEIPAFRRAAGFAGALTLLGGAAFLYSSTKQEDPTRKRIEQVLGVGMTVTGAGYIAAASLPAPLPAAVMSSSRIGAMTVLGGAARVLGPVGMAYSIAAPTADLVLYIQKDRLYWNQMTDAEKAADSARREAEWQDYRSRSPRTLYLTGE